MEDLKIEVSRIHKLDGSGATKAFCDLSVADSFIIKGLRIVAGEKGLFVVMPREEAKDGKWYSVVIPLTREVKDEIEKIVLENPSEREIRAAAAPQNILSMKQDGVIKVLQGLTSMSELARVIDLEKEE